MKKRVYSEFGKRVVKWLVDKDMTGTQLCAMLGISKNYLYRILYDERKADGIRAEIERLMKEGERIED